MESELPAIDVVDHTQSELPNLDGWIFDPGLPGLPATGVETLTCDDFLQLPECEFASMGELHGMPQQLEIPAIGGSSIKRKRMGAACIHIRKDTTCAG